MLKKAIQDALNKQLSREIYSSHLYLEMAGWYHSINLTGFSHWMRVQAQEELTHALKLFDYILARQSVTQIGIIEAPPSKWKTPLEAFEESLKHEMQVTQWINELADLAIKEGDHATHIMLQWFITEQVEEESVVSEILERLKMAGEHPSGILILDSQLKSRTASTAP